MSGTAPVTCLGRPTKAGEHLVRLGLPHSVGTLALDQRPWSARRPGGAAAGTPAKRRPWARVDPRASQTRPTPRHPVPSGPMQAGDHVACGPRRHVDPPRPTGAPATPSHSRSSAARTARRQRRGHRSLSVRTPGHRTPGHRTSARPVGRTSPQRDRGRGQGNDQPGRRPDILATGDTRWAARPRPGHGAWGARPAGTAPR
jgi:hypothetical protein